MYYAARKNGKVNSMSTDTKNVHDIVLSEINSHRTITTYIVIYFFSI